MSQFKRTEAFRGACAAVRWCLSLWLLAGLAGNSLHVSLAPHSHSAHGAALPSAAACEVTQEENGGHHHDCHAASHDEFKLTSSKRPAPDRAELKQPLARFAPIVRPSPLPAANGYGLSPPELSRSWQFFFRAALPVRAPSFLT
jgi:hypothetical protein